MNKPLGRIRKPMPRQQRSHRALRYACETLETRRLLADLSGMVYHDVNANGQKDLSEARQEGFQIFIDSNRNGVLDDGEPSSTSDGFGNWAIRDVPVGRHVVRQVERPGFAKVPQTPARGAYFVDVVADDQVITNLDFGNSRYASAKGQVFFDVNGDGIMNGSDSPMEGVRVYVDVNNNGVYDTGELAKRTDANGEYRIDFIYPGINTIRIEPPEGQRYSTRSNYRQLFYSNRRSENLNFGLTSTGHILGHVWSDLNGDGAQAPNEPDLAGRMVWLDQNQNGVKDADEVSVLTDALGNYGFYELKPGGYVVVADRPAGTQTIVPPAQRYEIDLEASQTVANRNFAFAPLGKIRGTVWGDDNSDGIWDLNEAGVPGRRVYLDLNGDGALQVNEPLFFTNSRGEYLFTDLPTGTYIVRLQPPANQVQTFPESGQIVDVQAGEIELDNNFGIALAGQIRGRVFSDRNGNAAFDPDENPLKWRRVFIDGNNNGLFDVGEVNTVTDLNGNYAFSGLRAGFYVVRAVPVPGTIQTVPFSGQHVVDVRGGAIAANRNFGFAQRASLSGLVFNDFNANGIQDVGEGGAAGVRVFIDANGNGQPDSTEHQVLTNPDGSYSFANFRPGNWTIRIVVPAGQSISVPANGAYTAQFLGGQSRAGFRFGLFAPGSISGVVFNDLNANGLQDVGETGLPGRSVFLDFNLNGVRDPGESQQMTDATGAYNFVNLQPGSYRVAVATSADETVTVPVDGFYNVMLTTGAALTNRNFGLASGTISGLVYNDINSNGIQDAGENGVAGVRIFIDEDADGVRDPAEEQVLTDASGIYVFSGLAAGTYTVRLDPDTGETVTDPVTGQHVVTLTTAQHSENNNFGLNGGGGSGDTGSISGIVYNDLDSSGTQDVGEAGLAGVALFIDENNNDTFDAGELTATSNASGAYSFAGLADGTYVVRVDPSASETVTDPGTGELSVMVAGGVNNPGNDFGVNRTGGGGDTGSISGIVYDDANSNGIQDITEAGLSGVAVFIDENGNDAFDTGEPTVISNVSGAYSFTGLADDTYVVRVDPATGETVTDPASGGISVPVTGGGDSPGNNFGVNRAGGGGSATISGQVFQDVDLDGIFTLGVDDAVVGRRVFIDVNGNGIFDAGVDGDDVMTGGAGTYSLPGLADGSYDIVVELEAGEAYSDPGSGVHNVVITGGTDAEDVDFALTVL